MNTPQTTPALCAHNLEIGYRGKKGKTTSISNGLNLRLNKGELICLLGPNGAGKSTLIRTLSGAQDPLDGTVEILGKSLASISPKEKARSISLVLTDTASMGLLTVESLVALGRHPHTQWSGNLSKHDLERVKWAMDAVDCSHLAGRHLGSLSDGERQKAMIARALAQESPVMFLDEPTAFLDLARRVELMRILRDLAQEQNLSILLSTHDLDLALRSSDRLWLFGSDRKLIQGAPEILALNGEIACAFHSERLDWDAEHGSFRLHRTPCLFVDLIGEGAQATWTKRALARLGYGIASPGQKSEFSISIYGRENAFTWLVSQGEKTTTFENFQQFVDWLETGLPSEQRSKDSHSS